MPRPKSSVRKTVLPSLVSLGKALDPPVTGQQASQYSKQGMPGTAGAYCVEDCQAWVDEHVTHRGESKPRNQQRRDDEDPDLSADAESTPALERYRAARAELAELDLAVKRNQLIPRDKLHLGLSQIASLIRSVTEQLERQFGTDAAALIDATLDDCDRAISVLCGDDLDYGDREPAAGRAAVDDPIQPGTSATVDA